ncbi:hypothetical protein FQR65_LT04507 [Abscondita terminalis]|nr:hypothetical protein FQR65_LT04507 [Abscondita terminalis]
MQKQQRLLKELAKISQAPPKGIALSAKDDKLNVFEANILGPENTPYENGRFYLELLVPENYPFSPPSIKFLTKVYHPNIDDNGRICLDLMKMPPKGSWKPTIGLEGMLIAIRMLLESPNPDDPLMTNIAEEFKNNKEEFIKKARAFTEEHANIQTIL